MTAEGPRAIRLGVNTVLFAGYDFRTACVQIARCGYDGVEVSAIQGMCEHLVLDAWRRGAPEIRDTSAEHGLRLLSMEVASLERSRLEPAFEAAAYLGIPVVNVGPGGKTGVEQDFHRQTDQIATMADLAHRHGVTLCVKAHVGASIYDTATTLRATEKIRSEGFGVDMDPSHIHRAGEKPEDALPRVLARVRHIHIRDCVGKGPSPGTPAQQACGRGDIALAAYCAAMVQGGYQGPVCLEVIGARELSLPAVSLIAAESYGYLNACLRSLGAR